MSAINALRAQLRPLSHMVMAGRWMKKSAAGGASDHFEQLIYSNF